MKDSNNYLRQSFTVQFNYNVYFTEHLFSPSNPTFQNFINAQSENANKKILFVIDEGVVKHHTGLIAEVKAYFTNQNKVSLIEEPVVIPGGEQAKNNIKFFDEIINSVDKHKIDRHSYITAIGGGSVLDLVGYAAAVSHRGIRHIRIPTTVLSQNDSGVGVKNGINYFGKKNFLGTFAPPAAVFNDNAFLATLTDEEWRSGISEAIKVALIKDSEFFIWLEENAALLVNRDMAAMQYLIKHCAELHLQHIAGKDPFETGSSRPLDFGHWSAHKVEQLSNFSIRHGEAVALGIALDTTYSYLSGRLAESAAIRIVALLKKLGFMVSHPLMEIKDEVSPVLAGLNEFREHLGGQLTIMLLTDIGKGEEVHEMQTSTLRSANDWIKQHS
ncbi:MAG: 3-dehydroquinate synthase [Segetibacter sp.]